LAQIVVRAFEYAHGVYGYVQNSFKENVMRGAFNLGGSQKTSKPFCLGVCLLLSCLCVFSVGCSAIRSVIGIGTEKSEDALLQYIGSTP